MFHHLPDHLKAVGLAEIRRVLVPGGRLVLVDFGNPDRLVAEAQAAGFGTVTTARVGPSFLFSLQPNDAGSQFAWRVQLGGRF